MGEGTPRCSAQRHARFLGSAIAFLDITLETSRHNVIPGIQPASGAGDDMVDGQIMALVTAILSGVVISVQNVSP